MTSRNSKTRPRMRTGSGGNVGIGRGGEATFSVTTTEISIPAEPVANPRRTRLTEDIVLRPVNQVILYGVFNNEKRIDELVEASEMHPLIADKMKEALFLSEVAGEAKREERRLNRYRFENPVDSMLGPAELREQTVARTEWATITGQDYEDIDDGTRPNG